MLDQYVNDRPYVASSFMSVAIARVFNSALAGNGKDRPAGTPWKGPGHDNCNLSLYKTFQFAEKVHLHWIGAGTEEPERMQTRLRRLHASLLEANIQHVFYDSPGTDHEWQTWRRDLKDFAPRLF